MSLKPLEINKFSKDTNEIKNLRNDENDSGILMTGDALKIDKPGKPDPGRSTKTMKMDKPGKPEPGSSTMPDSDHRPSTAKTSAAEKEEEKPIVQKHGAIKDYVIPAKMSRTDMGMAEKLSHTDLMEDETTSTDNKNEPYSPNQAEKLLQDGRDFLLHVILLIVVTTIAVSSMPVSRFYYHDILTHFVTDSTFITESGLHKNYWDIVILDQIWDYFDKILLPLIYSEVNDKISQSYKAKFKNADDILLLNDNVLVALPRIRQVRVRNDSCEVPEGFMYIFDSCYYFFSSEVEDKEPFGLKKGTLWTYSDSSVTEAWPVSGEISKYTGGGYFMDFSHSLDKTQELIREMWNNTWIDHGSRAIIIDLATYTQRDNLFCIATLLAELPPSGGVITSGDVRIQKLLRYESPEDFVILGFELALAVLILLFTMDNVIKLVKQPMRYVSNLWNIVEWLILALGYATGAVGVWRYLAVEKHLGGLRQAIDQKKHFSFHAIRDVQTTYEVLIGCLALVAWLKTCKYASLVRPGALILRAFHKVRMELVALTLMLLLLTFGFAMFAHVIFGTHVKDFNSIENSIFTLAAIFAGGLHFYKECEETRPILAPIFFICYLFVVMLLFLNWFASAIVYGLKEASQEIDLTGEEIYIQDILRNAYKKLLLFCKCKKTYVNVDEKDLHNQKLSDFEIVNNLLDRYGFSRLERDLFLRRHGMATDTSQTVDVDNIIADLNGMNRYYIEVEEHVKVLERIDSVKKKLELLEHTLADMVVKVDVLVDKSKFQEEEAKIAK